MHARVACRDGMADARRMRRVDFDASGASFTVTLLGCSLLPYPQCKASTELDAPKQHLVQLLLSGTESRGNTKSLVLVLLWDQRYTL
jgi:hypothetical protein